MGLERLEYDNFSGSTNVPNNQNTPTDNNNPEGKTDKTNQQTTSNIKKSSNKKVIFPLIITIIAVVILIYIFSFTKSNNSSTTTVNKITSSNATTTVANLQSYSINSCTIINQPGTYLITSNITTKIKSGSCINITSDNVVINGNNKHLIGSGPYIDVAPFTYGILISGASNVSINNLNISRFSYSLYLKNSQNNNLIKLYISNSTVSNLFLNNSSNNKIKNSTIYGSQSNYGGVNIKSGIDNSFIGTSFINNAYYGIYINSTGNTFNSDTFLQNPTDLICGSNANTKNTNYFSQTTCQTNQLCNFATCSSNNYYTIANVKLSKNVNTCGSIDSYGTYTILQNLNLSDYTEGASTYPCITITAPNVKLNCNGKTIISSYYGIYLKNLYNTTVENCNFNSDTYGVYVNSSINTYLSNINSFDVHYGVYVENSTTAFLNNSILNNGVTGVYENDTIGFVIKNVTTIGNIYGEYLDGGRSNVYNNILTENSIIGDFYCPANTYNSSSVASIYNSTCITTDCGFASNVCTKLLPPPLSIIPINSCQAITIAGQYEINQNISFSGSCIIINVPDVKLNCNNKLILGSNNGYAILDNGYSNLSISNCKIQNYDSGLYASNLHGINLENTTISGVSYGLVYENVTSSSVGNVNISSFKSSGISIIKSSQISVKNNVANGGLFNATGFVLDNVTNSNIMNNTGNNNQLYGFSIFNSINNTVSNNKALSNNLYDYFCGPTENINSNKVNVNTGIKKLGCPWLIIINPDSINSCFNFASSGYVSFQSDMLYTYGNTCYTINNLNNKTTNNTSINCFGHTIYATNGGTFVNVNTTGVTISNCYLVGFTSPIIDSANHLSLYNITIMNSKTPINTSNPDYIKEYNVTVIN